MSSDRQQDLSGNTAQFQAFVQRSEPEPVRRSPMPWVIGIAVVVVVIAVVAILLAS
jgi:hypothetical protein